MTSLGLVVLWGIAGTMIAWILGCFGYAIGGYHESKFWRNFNVSLQETITKLRKEIVDLHADAALQTLKHIEDTKAMSENFKTLTTNKDFSTSGPNNVIREAHVDTTKLPRTFELPDAVMKDWEPIAGYRIGVEDAKKDVLKPAIRRGRGKLAANRKRRSKIAKA